MLTVPPVSSTPDLSLRFQPLSYPYDVSDWLPKRSPKLGVSDGVSERNPRSPPLTSSHSIRPQSSLTQEAGSPVLQFAWTKPSESSSSVSLRPHIRPSANPVSPTSKMLRIDPCHYPYCCYFHPSFLNNL